MVEFLVIQGVEFVKKYFPETEIPTQKKERQKLHKLVDQTLLQDPEFQELHSQFQTKIALAVELIEQARNKNLPFTTSKPLGKYVDNKDRG